LLNKLSLDMFQ